ncbi:MAG: GHKL domain-containing protein [Calditrichaeota bacterium]|nr:MAG: GHKL domain-containing protein [Calditrichota bacterium]
MKIFKLKSILPTKKSFFYGFLGWVIWILISTLVFKFQTSSVFPKFNSLLFSLIISTFNEIPFIFLSFLFWWHVQNLNLSDFSPLRLVLTHLILAFCYSALWLTILTKFNYEVGGIEGLMAIRIDSFILWQFKEGVMKYVVLVGIFYLVEDYKTFQKNKIRQKELKISARESELKALKFQINPHFLFNSLNSVNALVTQNPQSARKMIVLLSDFFRSTLEIKADELITLDEELILMEKYFAIEKSRFSDRLSYEIDCKEEAKKVKVPSLILQPICENAIKHGLSKVVENGKIKIEAKIENGFLIIRISNPCEMNCEEPERIGIGLENVKNRLEQFFGEKSKFETSRKNEIFISQIEIPI